MSTPRSDATKNDSSQDKPPVEGDRYKMYPQILAGCAASLATLSAGMAFSWPAVALSKLMINSTDLHLTLNEGGWVVSALLMGASLGPILSVLLVDHLGRKWFLYLTGVPYLLCWILTYFAESFECLFAARFIAGLGVGGSYAAVPMFLGEIAETRIRGALGTMTNLQICTGSLMMYSVGPWVDRKTLALASLTPAALFLLIFFWIPETPYHHLRKGRMESARKSLVWLRGSAAVDEELREISNVIEVELKQRGKITELFTVPANRKASLLMLLLIGAQQASGMVAIMSYIGVVFANLSLNVDGGYVLILTGLVSFASHLAATCVIDKIGKRPLMLISSAGTAICVCTVATYYYVVTGTVDVGAASWVPVIAMLVFFVFFMFGLGPVPYSVLAEIYPMSVKAWATTVVSIYGSILGTIVAKCYQLVVYRWGDHAIFYGFCICEVVLGFVVYFTVPETKGKSFTEIQEILGRRAPERKEDASC